MVITVEDMMRRVLKDYYEKELKEFYATKESAKSDPMAFGDFWIEEKFKEITGLW